MRKNGSSAGGDTIASVGRPVQRRPASGCTRIAVALCAVALTTACTDGTGTTTPSRCLAPPCPAYVPPPPSELPCYSARELDEIDRAVRIWFEGDESAGVFVCSASSGSRDLTRIQARLYQALMYMKQARFDQPLPWTPEPLYAWFTGIVRGIRVRTDIPNAFCSVSEGVLHVRGTRDEARGPESSIPSYVKVLVHEARHIDVGGHTCGYTKDNTIAELGAFGVVYYLMMWAAEHDPRATAEERAYALNQAASLQCAVFCQECR